jgi:hypothetical protein
MKKAKFVQKSYFYLNQEILFLIAWEAVEIFYKGENCTKQQCNF